MSDKLVHFGAVLLSSSKLVHPLVPQAYSYTRSHLQMESSQQQLRNAADAHKHRQFQSEFEKKQTNLALSHSIREMFMASWASRDL